MMDMASPAAAAQAGNAEVRGATAYRLAVLARRLSGWSFVLLLLLLWEAAVRLGLINGNLFPPPSAISQALVDLAAEGLLWGDIAASVGRVCVGFAFGAIIGVGLGLLLGRLPRLAACVMPFIDLVRPISVIAWIPIAILWFGLGDRSAWFIIFLGSVFPIFTNTYLGARSVALIHVQVAQCFGVSRVRFVRQILVPTALPHILAGLRSGLGVGWMCVIAAELISSTSGLGYMIELARTTIETEKILAGMVVIGVIGAAMNAVMLYLEHRLIPHSGS